MSQPRPRDMPLRDVLLLQRDACARAGSALYSCLLEAMAEDLDNGGIVDELLSSRSADALANALPLRFLGGLHRIVLEGRAPDLARYFPSAGGRFESSDDPVGAFWRAVTDHRAELEQRLSDGVQTNEVGRAAALVGGFHLIAQRWGLPLRLLEVGSSGGLLLRWDHYHYDTGASAWGDPESPVRFRDVWGPTPPVLDSGTAVIERRGCDIHPVDLTDLDGALRLRSFLWPDMVERRTRLDAAIAVARKVPVDIDESDAGEWVEGMLADGPVPGRATVVFHAIVLQYLPRRSFDRVREAIRAAGERATPDAPVAWLRMEPAGVTADVQLTVWPDGTDRRVATTAYHGPPVDWHG